MIVHVERLDSEVLLRSPPQQPYKTHADQREQNQSAQTLSKATTDQQCADTPAAWAQPRSFRGLCPSCGLEQIKTRLRRNGQGRHSGRREWAISLTRRLLNRKGQPPLTCTRGVEKGELPPPSHFFLNFFWLVLVKEERLECGNSGQFSFQPVEVVVIVISHGATAPAEDRTDLFETVAKNQQIEDLTRTLIHQLSQFTDQDLLV